MNDHYPSQEERGGWPIAAAIVLGVLALVDMWRRLKDRADV